MSLRFSAGSLLLLMASAGILSSCKPKKGTADISGIKIDLKIHRTETDLDEVYTEYMKNPSGDMYALFNTRFFNRNRKFAGYYLFDNPDTFPEKQATDQLLAFVRDPYVQGLIDTVRKVFPENYPFAAVLKDPLARCKYYFPGFTVPEVYTCVSGFQFDVMVEKDMILLGLDYFLGRNFKYYSTYPEYLRKYFVKENIPFLTLRQIAFMLMEDMKTPEPHHLLDYILLNGKSLYFMEKVFPGAPDSTLIGYSAKQMKWVGMNEAEVWKNLIPKIYSQDNADVEKLINRLPFTPGYSEDSPGELGAFIGWHIIRSYAQTHPGLSLQQVMAEKDNEGILKNSSYKP